MIHGGLERPRRFDLYQWHKSFGFVALALTAARLAARLRRPRASAAGFPALGATARGLRPRRRSTS